MRIKPLKLKKLPYKSRTEKETAELLHCFVVLARKRQIELNKLDTQNCEPYKERMEQINYYKQIGKDYPERKEKPKSKKVVMIDGKPTVINN